MHVPITASPIRFVALGDSITVGLGDPMPDGTWRGWAALLAECLGAPGTVEFHNVAESGALSSTLFRLHGPTGIVAAIGTTSDRSGSGGRWLDGG